MPAQADHPPPATCPEPAAAAGRAHAVRAAARRSPMASSFCSVADRPRQTPLCAERLQGSSTFPWVSGTRQERHIPVPPAPAAAGEPTAAALRVGASPTLCTNQLQLLSSHCEHWRRWSLVSGNTELNLSSSFLVPSSSHPANSLFAVVAPSFCIFHFLLFYFYFFSGFN